MRYVSGYTRNAILHDGPLDEGVHLLSKPFSQKDLVSAVRVRLDARDAAPTLASNVGESDPGELDPGPKRSEQAAATSAPIRKAYIEKGRIRPHCRASSPRQSA